MSSNIIQQHHLERVVCSLFPNENISSNVKKLVDIINPATGRLLELDCWIEKHHLAFEFQDAYHYITTRLSHLSFGIISEKDCFKKEAVRSKVETLLLIPCWWDGSVESLISTIQFFRPDLLKHENADALPISLNPPIEFFERYMVGTIPNVGELMLASFPDSSKFVISFFKSDSWWLGEKYDGVRMCWHPKEKKIYTRSGLQMHLLQPFADSMVDCFLDGEIWLGRGMFMESYKVIQALFHEVPWSLLRIIGFDNPEPKKNKDKYERRFSDLLVKTPREHPFIVIPSRFACASERKVANAAEMILKEGGEGVILQKMKSVYEHGRSQSLAKIKASRDDKEAIVVNINENSGVELQTPEGVLFTVLNKDLQFSHPLKRGDIVSFSYETYSKRSAPVNPVIYRIRSDLIWSDALRNSARSLNHPSNKILGRTENPKGHWTVSQNSNVRSLLARFARSKGHDPLVPETWYSVSRKSVEDFTNARAALGVFRGGFVKTLMAVFPNIGLDESKFNIKSYYWDPMPNRRKFFVEFAKRSGFDPLHAQNWYNICQYKSDLLNSQGANAVLVHYNDRLPDALVHLFPEVRFNRSQFISSLQLFYEREENRKSFFVGYAKARFFDPLVAKNWYFVSRRDIENRKGARYVLSYYRSLPEALRVIFPNVGFQKSMFSVKSSATAKQNPIGLKVTTMKTKLQFRKRKFLASRSQNLE